MVEEEPQDPSPGGGRCRVPAEIGTWAVPVEGISARRFTGEIDHPSCAVREGFEPRTPDAMGLRDAAPILAIRAPAERGAWMGPNPDETLRGGRGTRRRLLTAPGVGSPARSRPSARCRAARAASGKASAAMASEATLAAWQ